MKTKIFLLAICVFLGACVMPPPPLKPYNVHVVNIAKSQSHLARLYIPYSCDLTEIDGRRAPKIRTKSIDETLFVLDGGKHHLIGECTDWLSKDIDVIVDFDAGKTYRLFFSTYIDDSNSSVFKIDISGRVYSVVEEVKDIGSQVSDILDVLWTLENPNKHTVNGRKVFFDQLILSRSGMLYRKTSWGDTNSYITTSAGYAFYYEINFDTSSLVFYMTDDSFNRVPYHTTYFRVIDGALILKEHSDIDPVDGEIIYKKYR